MFVEGMSSTFPRIGRPFGPGGSGSLFLYLQNRFSAYMKKQMLARNSREGKPESIIVAQECRVDIRMLCRKGFITTQDRVKSLVMATLNDPHVTVSGVYVPFLH